MELSKFSENDGWYYWLKTEEEKGIERKCIANYSISTADVLNGDRITLKEG